MNYMYIEMDNATELVLYVIVRRWLMVLLCTSYHYQKGLKNERHGKCAWNNCLISPEDQN